MMEWPYLFCPSTDWNGLYVPDLGVDSAFRVYKSVPMTRQTIVKIHSASGRVFQGSHLCAWGE
uniref:Macaca fascicularis brain cDNA, clone: QmoA-10543 n=1 Tax=Macaca fascicularis TaxID=9541 RepID=I7GE18_MACFA|nr:unnamed protein product [Macaca fascicularis]